MRLRTLAAEGAAGRWSDFVACGHVPCLGHATGVGAWGLNRSAAPPAQSSTRIILTVDGNLQIGPSGSGVPCTGMQYAAPTVARQRGGPACTLSLLGGAFVVCNDDLDFRVLDDESGALGLQPPMRLGTSRRDAAASGLTYRCRAERHVRIARLHDREHGDDRPLRLVDEYADRRLGQLRQPVRE